MGSRYRVEMLGCANYQAGSDGLDDALARDGFGGAITAEEAGFVAVRARASVAG